MPLYSNPPHIFTDCEHCDSATVQVFTELLELVDAGSRAKLFLVCAIRSSSLDVEKAEPWKEWLQRPCGPSYSYV